MFMHRDNELDTRRGSHAQARTITHRAETSIVTFEPGEAGSEASLLPAIHPLTTVCPSFVTQLHSSDSLATMTPVTFDLPLHTDQWALTGMSRGLLSFVLIF